MPADEGYIPFSQRNGFSPIPPQLQLGEVSDEQRRLLNYAWDREVDRRQHNQAYQLVDDAMKELAKDAFVYHFHGSPAKFSATKNSIKQTFERFIHVEDIGSLFDLVEFIIRHDGASLRLKGDLASTFEKTRSAYRVIDGRIVPIGNEHQSAAIERAFHDVDAAGANASKAHLIDAGLELRNGNWADSVRESIHAVEAMARKIDPSAKTLGQALKTLGNSVHLHGSLKDGFGKLYGYTNDEKGIRHALSEASSPVDEVDALFMYGACASFVSYLIARERER
ncbi:AbiJ-NTD4 domain-containing protein [Phaeobacter sp. HF9A]|uniref:AbiJ-NTD4 domain-containing protein n=1 Tax=Phaeobacter sp. HF9A TaxID=2721561 RepID=UPI0014304A70|nr:hypothetical protein [Phaeobacter sp. HF9A]NIZ15750.1 hypothetical protein [Phaeobacter sp. HF9A]